MVLLLAAALAPAADNPVVIGAFSLARPGAERCGRGTPLQRGKPVAYMTRIKFIVP